MKILALADTTAKYYYDYYRPGKLKEFDLILACGDLRREYLEFIATMASCPLVYVHGNHDDALIKNPPGGCICADGQLLVINGVRILGLGGCYRYREGENLYTEREMQRRVNRLSWKIRRQGGFDILLTHAPARGFHDLDDVCHRGFSCFSDLIARYEPQFFVHGHVHRSYGIDIPQRDTLGQTTVINAYNYCAFEYGSGAFRDGETP